MCSLLHFVRLLQLSVGDRGKVDSEAVTGRACEWINNHYG